jgi:uncharacterized protein
MSDEVQAFIDAAVQDHSAARDILRRSPELLNARYIHGETVLHFLAVEGYTDGVRFLAEAGAQVDVPNEFGDTALVDAAALGDPKVVAVLIEHGADPNASSTVRDNVVHAAAQSGNPEVLDLVLGAGGRGDYVTQLGETVWDALSGRAETRDQMEAVLRKHGVGPRGRTTGETR